MFIKVAESTEIFFPIFQLGCFNASFIVIFLKLLSGVLWKGPPEAVKYISSILFISIFFKPYHNEKCSESTGINFVLLFFNAFKIKPQPQIIDSLFAIAISFVNLIIFNVGSKPYIPTIELIV